MKGKQEMDRFIRDRFQGAKGIDEGCLGTGVTFFGASLIGQSQQLDCIAVAESTGAYTGWQMVTVLKQDSGQVPGFTDPDSVELFFTGERRQFKASADIPHSCISDTRMRCHIRPNESAMDARAYFSIHPVSRSYSAWERRPRIIVKASSATRALYMEDAPSERKKACSLVNPPDL